jgi:hypothetical protein
MPPADGRCRASSAIENAVNNTAIIARSTASGVIPPANDVAAPIESAVATAGAMCVMDWNTSEADRIPFEAVLSRDRHSDLLGAGRRDAGRHASDRSRS